MPTIATVSFLNFSLYVAGKLIIYIERKYTSAPLEIANTRAIDYQIYQTVSVKFVNEKDSIQVFSLIDRFSGMGNNIL